jgi:hypothetical protein
MKGLIRKIIAQTIGFWSIVTSSVTENNSPLEKQYNHWPQIKISSYHGTPNDCENRNVDHDVIKTTKS